MPPLEQPHKSCIFRLSVLYIGVSPHLGSRSEPQTPEVSHRRVGFRVWGLGWGTIGTRRSIRSKSRIIAEPRDCGVRCGCMQEQEEG